MRRTIGQEIIDKACLSDRDAEPLAGLIDGAIADAFKTGFEHAVVGGKEAARKLPQLADAMPLVLYFRNESDRQEFADMINAVKPHMIEVKVPEKA